MGQICVGGTCVGGTVSYEQVKTVLSRRPANNKLHILYVTYSYFRAKIMSVWNRNLELTDSEMDKIV